MHQICNVNKIVNCIFERKFFKNHVILEQDESGIIKIPLGNYMRAMQGFYAIDSPKEETNDNARDN